MYSNNIEPFGKDRVNNELYERVITKDKTVTFLNRKYKETYHSISGAREEAIKKYIEPLGNILNKRELRVIDFCFGLGYNTLSLIELSKSKIIIDAIENDINIIQKILSINNSFKYLEKLKENLRELFKEKNNIHNKPIKFFMDNKRIQINLFVNDAEHIIFNDYFSKNEYDAILFDPFSPKKQPELWSKKIFNRLYNLLKRDGRLTTYSCAGWIRRNMREAGFVIEDGPSIGRRAPSTIAIKTATKDIL